MDGRGAKASPVSPSFIEAPNFLLLTYQVGPYLLLHTIINCILLADFFTNGTTLENNCFYALKATLNDVVVYRGKAYATDVETADVSIHNNTKYVKNNTTNEYVIIN